MNLKGSYSGSSVSIFSSGSRCTVWSWRTLKRDKPNIDDPPVHCISELEFFKLYLNIYTFFFSKNKHFEIYNIYQLRSSQKSFKYTSQSPVKQFVVSLILPRNIHFKTWFGKWIWQLNNFSIAVKERETYSWSSYTRFSLNAIITCFSGNTLKWHTRKQSNVTAITRVSEWVLTNVWFHQKGTYSLPMWASSSFSSLMKWEQKSRLIKNSGKSVCSKDNEDVAISFTGLPSSPGPPFCPSWPGLPCHFRTDIPNETNTRKRNQNVENALDTTCEGGHYR